MDSTQPDAPAPRLPVTHRRRQADEWALVLTAEGIPNQVARADGGFSVKVEPEDFDQATEILDAWQLERAERAHRLRVLPVRSATFFEVAIAYSTALCLLAFHLGLDLSGRHRAFVEAGASRAEQVLSGSFERLLTALTLHSDLTHVLGNTFFGGFFLALLAARLGIGVAVLAAVVTGAFGNLANAVYYGSHHGSIGASTSVFGLVGVLAGLAAWQRHQRAVTGRGGWVALGAGLGILAMLGTGGPRVDVSAHIFGLAAGALAGLVLAVPMLGRPPPRPAIQAMAFLSAFALLAAAWQQAWRAAGDLS